MVFTAHDHASPDGFNPYKYPGMGMAYKEMSNYHPLYTPMGNSLVLYNVRQTSEVESFWKKLK